MGVKAALFLMPVEGAAQVKLGLALLPEQKTGVMV
jgi:hypothetical protein